jgi:hypothetical protein
MQLVPEFMSEILTLVATESHLHVALNDHGCRRLGGNCEEYECTSYPGDWAKIAERRCMLAELVEAGFITALEDGGNPATALLKIAECSLQLRVASSSCKRATDSAKPPLAYCFRFRDRHIMQNTMHILGCAFATCLKRRSWSVLLPAWRARREVEARSLTVLPMSRLATILFQVLDSSSEDSLRATANSNSEGSNSTGDDTI